MAKRTAEEIENEIRNLYKEEMGLKERRVKLAAELEEAATLEEAQRRMGDLSDAVEVRPVGVKPVSKAGVVRG